MIVVGGALLAVVFLVVVVRRRKGVDVQHVRVDGARPWAGPARLNGAPALRLPAAVPRPGALLTDRPRRRRLPARAGVPVAWWWGLVAVGVWVLVGAVLRGSGVV